MNTKMNNSISPQKHVRFNPEVSKKEIPADNCGHHVATANSPSRRISFATIEKNTIWQQLPYESDELIALKKLRADSSGSESNEMDSQPAKQSRVGKLKGCCCLS